jgi:c-di-GMP-binding flagellar brake protein YcgR
VKAKQQDMTTNLQRRKEHRDNCSVNVEYYLDSEDCERIDCGPWNNVTSDISYSGMCLYSNREITKGHRLKIYLRHVSKDPLVAQVRWCNRLSDNLFRMGVCYR